MMRLFLPCLLWSSLGFAGESLTFNAVRVVTHGEALPSITFNLEVAGSIDVRFDCGASGSWSMQKTVAPGSSETLEFKGIREGWHQCDGTVALTTETGETGEMNLPLKVGSLPKIGLSAPKENLDLTARSIVVEATRAVAACQLTVLGPRAELLAQTGGDLADPLRPSFRWEDGGKEVVKLDIECADADGFRSVLHLSPWQTAIPHEDVVFASSSAEIPGDEVHKLEASWAELAKAVELYGSVVKVELYVAGYTDTVGDAASNQALSQRRARAIGTWFRQRGFSGAIHYQGFGEAVLAVPTPDQTDQPANRRVLYLLAGSVPAVSKDLPQQNWKKL